MFQGAARAGFSRQQVTRTCRRFTGSDPIPATCGCSATCRRILRPIRRSSSCCTAARRRPPATISGAGWSTLADRYGFALLMPEQQRSNNPNGCFNWFLPGDIERGRGEALSIRQMVETMVDRQRHRSASRVRHRLVGGRRDDVRHAGVLPGGVRRQARSLPACRTARRRNVQQAFESMYQSPTRSAREWGDLVRKAASHARRDAWPRVSVWHGSADKTVIPAQCAGDSQAMDRRARAAADAVSARPWSTAIRARPGSTRRARS